MDRVVRRKSRIVREEGLSISLLIDKKLAAMVVQARAKEHTSESGWHVTWLPGALLGI